MESSLRAASEKKSGQKNHKDRYRTDVPYHEINEFEYPLVCGQGPAVCKFVENVAFAHFPTHENHHQESSYGHQEIGREFVEEIEYRLAEYLYVRQRAERKRTQCAD